MQGKLDDFLQTHTGSGQSAWGGGIWRHREEGQEDGPGSEWRTQKSRYGLKADMR